MSGYELVKIISLVTLVLLSIRVTWRAVKLENKVARLEGRMLALEESWSRMKLHIHYIHSSQVGTGEPILPGDPNDDEGDDG